MDNKLSNFEAIKPADIKENPYNIFSKEWPIIAAGSPDDYDEMTVGWGALGTAWGNQLPIAVIFVSPNRYTHKYLESHDTFSINVLPETMRKDEAFIGTHSGRNENKAKEMGMEVAFTENGTPIFPQSNLILECKKIYEHTLDKSKFSDVLAKTYSEKIFDGVAPHTVYFGEIINCWEKKADEGSEAK